MPIPVPVISAPAAVPAAPPQNLSMSNAFAVLDKMGADHAGDGPQPEPSRKIDAPPPSPNAAPKPDASKPAAAAPEKPAEVDASGAAPANAAPKTDKPAEDPAAPKPGDKATDKPGDAPKAPQSGWAKFRETEKLLKAAEAERESLRKEIETLRTSPAVVKEHPEFKSLLQKAEADAKRAAELEDHIRFVDYTKSKEFVDKYETPYKETAAEATARAVQLRLMGEDGKHRNLTPEEFWSIVRIGDEDSAITAAEALFGEGSAKAAHVLERRNEIIRAHQAMESAKGVYQKEGAARAQQAQQAWQAQQAQAQESAKATAAKFRNLVTEGEKNEKMKDVFAAAPEDTEGAEMLSKYRHEADRAFMGGAQIKEGDEPWTPEMLTTKHAVMRNRAGAFPYTVRQLRNANAKIVALEAKLASFQKSEPGAGDTKTDAAPAPAGNALEQALSKLDSLQ